MESKIKETNQIVRGIFAINAAGGRLNFDWKKKKNFEYQIFYIPLHAKLLRHSGRHLRQANSRRTTTVRKLSNVPLKHKSSIRIFITRVQQTSYGMKQFCNVKLDSLQW